MENILVTGGAGYIGSQVCKRLSQLGYNPIALDNLSRGHEDLVQWGPLVKASIHDFDRVKEALSQHRIQAVLHFAAFAYIQESVERPSLYFENNVAGMALLLEAMAAVGVKTMVFSSSCATYGVAQTARIREDHPQNPINPYGLTKLIGEQMLEKYRQHHGFEFCALRYFNVAGSDPDLETGEWHEPEPHILPNLIQAALNHKPVSIHGRHYPTPDGTCVRDFIHVADLAEAHILVLEKLLHSQKIADFYNLGNSAGYSLLELVKATEDIVGEKIEIHFKENRPGDPPLLIADAEKFAHDFNWRPEISDMQSIIRTAHRWILQKKGR